MRLTILGKYGPYPKAGGACSSYLVSSRDAKILLDAGSGSFSNLQKHVNFRELDAIILSHLHSDHISDLLVMRYAIQNNKVPPVPLYLPSLPKNIYELFRDEPAYKTTVITEDMQLHVKDALIVFRKMTHSVDSYAVKVRCGESVLVYSGDTNQNDRLAGFAEHADALLCDTAFSNKTLPMHPPHLSSAQAAEIAREADVKKLYLTHVSPEQDESVLLNEAKTVFKNSEITVENNTVII